MSKCPGLHCDGCPGGGGGGGVLVALAAVIILGAIVARPAEHAADELLHVVLVILEVAAITAGSLGVIALAVVVTVKARRRRAVSHAERPPAVSVRPPAPVADRPAPAIRAKRVRTIDPANRKQAAYSVRIKEQK